MPDTNGADVDMKSYRKRGGTFEIKIAFTKEVSLLTTGDLVPEISSNPRV